MGLHKGVGVCHRTTLESSHKANVLLQGADKLVNMTIHSSRYTSVDFSAASSHHALCSPGFKDDG